MTKAKADPRVKALARKDQRREYSPPVITAEALTSAVRGGGSVQADSQFYQSRA